MSQLDVGGEAENSLLLATAEDGLLATGQDDTIVEGPSLSLTPVLVAVALFLTAIAMTVPSRPKLILAAAGSISRASYFTGIVDAMTAAVEIFTNPVLGGVSDAVGRRPVLIFSQFGELAALLIIARFNQFLITYLIAYLLIGLTGVYFMTVNTIVADVSDCGDSDHSNRRAANYGKLGATFGGCFLVGPALGGFIEDHFYATASFHAASFLVMLSIAWVYFLVPETRVDSIVHDGATECDEVRSVPSSSVFSELITVICQTEINPLPRIRDIFTSDALKWLAAGIAVASLAQGGLNSIFFLYLNTRLGWGSAETGYFLSAVGLALLVSQGIFAPVAVNRLGEIATILIGYSFSVVHYIIYANATTPVLAYLGLVVGCIGFMAEPAMKGLISRQVVPSKQGSLQGALSGLTTLLRPLSPLFATTIFGYGNGIGRPGIAFLAIASIATAALSIVAMAFTKPGLK